VIARIYGFIMIGFLKKGDPLIFDPSVLLLKISYAPFLYVLVGRPGVKQT
jgi:hypothetical protein